MFIIWSSINEEVKQIAFILFAFLTLTTADTEGQVVWVKQNYFVTNEITIEGSELSSLFLCPKEQW